MGGIISPCRKEKTKKMPLRKLSLFSGIGGDDLASDWAGIETICFVERDEYCQKILHKHWPNIPIIGDVKDVTKDKIQEPIDVVAGGFPCQPNRKWNAL